MNVHVFIGYLLLFNILFPVNADAVASDMAGSHTEKTAAQLNKLAEDTLVHDHHTSLELALKALDQAGDNLKQKARSYLNIGEAYYKAEQYEKSTDHFLKANKIYQQLNNHEKTGYTYLSIGINHFYTGNYAESIRAYKNMESHKELCDMFEKEKNYHNALKHYKSYIDLKDSIDHNDTRTQIAEIESEYKHKLNKQELEKQQLKLQRSQIQKAGLLIFMLLFFSFSIILYRNNVRRKKIQLQLNEHKHNLQRLLEEQSEKLDIEISERKLAEESDKLKSAFLANMSHELRTPMNAIIAFSSFLNNQDLPEEKRDEYIQHINSSGKSLLQIIDDIVDSAKIEAKQLKIHHKKTDITHLLKEVYELYSHSLKVDNKEEIDLILDLPYKNPVIIKTDPVRLKQIISNLVENAKKYTQHGYIRFGYEIQSGQVEFFVEDTGIGIPEDKLKYIFERFSRIDYKDDVRLSGTGLGLAICKDLIELMEGHIKVRSEPGAGTVFTCSLPYDELEIQEDALANREDDQSILDPADFNWNDKTVLIAEDEDLNFKVLQAALNRTGAIIVRAMNGEEAIEICEQQKIDLILMDIQMPKMDGLEATRKIKSMLPALPIVAQTSFALNGERERCLKAGCDEYLSKPIDLQRLLHIAQHYLN